MAKPKTPMPKARRKGARYTPVSKRQDRPDAIAWLIKSHPELSDAQISKLFAGATLTTDAGSSGSHALGTVHQGSWFEILTGDENRLSNTFQAQIGKPFIKYNGLNARPPRLKIHLALDIGVKGQLQVASIAANELGLEVDEDQIRQMTMLRRPTGKALVGTRQGIAGVSDE